MKASPERRDFQVRSSLDPLKSMFKVHDDFLHRNLASTSGWQPWVTVIGDIVWESFKLPIPTIYFRVHTEVFDPFGLDICAGWHLVFLEPFIKKSIFFPMFVFGIFENIRWLQLLSEKEFLMYSFFGSSILFHWLTSSGFVPVRCFYYYKSVMYLH